MTARARQTARRPDVEGLERRESPSGLGSVAIISHDVGAPAAGGHPVVLAAETSIEDLAVQKVREAA